MDLTEAEDIKKRWQEYTEELYKKDLYDPDSCDGVITHLEPDILECEVKWASGKQWKQWQTLVFAAPKSLQMVTAAIKWKDACSLEEKLWPT